MKRFIKRLLIVLGAVILAAALLVGFGILHSKNYSVPEQAASIENSTGLLQAHGRSLYDAQGQPLQLRGINAGQILLQEGWMSPFALEPLMHVKRKLFGYNMPGAQECAIDALAGKQDAPGSLPVNCNFQ